MAPDKEKPPAAVSAAGGFDDLAENFLGRHRTRLPLASAMRPVKGSRRRQQPNHQLCRSASPSRRAAPRGVAGRGGGALGPGRRLLAGELVDGEGTVVAVATTTAQIRARMLGRRDTRD